LGEGVPELRAEVFHVPSEKIPQLQHSPKFEKEQNANRGRRGDGEGLDFQPATLKLIAA